MREQVTSIKISRSMSNGWSVKVTRDAVGIDSSGQPFIAGKSTVTSYGVKDPDSLAALVASLASL